MTTPTPPPSGPCCPVNTACGVAITPASVISTATCANDGCPNVSFHDVSVHYGTRQVVKHVNFSAPSCQVTALVGPSGCGKSTLLSCINRLIDLVPSASVQGQICLSGQDIRTDVIPVTQLRKRVGMIFQQPHPFPLSIRRNLALPLREHGIKTTAEINAISERCLRAVGLWDEVADRLDTSAITLSGGQQQRLCLARALVLKPQVLLLDEPCSALDPIASGVIEDLIISLKGFYTVVMVTHDLAQARRVADHVVVCGHDGNSGQVLEQGPCATIFAQPLDKRTAAYLAGQRL